MNKFNELYESIMNEGSQDSIKALRADLKKAGLGINQVSVTLKRGGMSEQILVQVKDDSIDLDKVKKIAMKYEDVIDGTGTFVQVQKMK